MSASIPIERDLTEMASQLLCDRGDSILLFYSKKTRAMAITCSISNLGNSKLHPETNLVTLNGFSSKDTSPMSFDLDRLFQKFKNQIPTIEDI